MRRAIRRHIGTWQTRQSAGVEQHQLYDHNDQLKSFWHDVDLKDSSCGPYDFNYVVEIPQNRLAKLEMNKWVAGNAITQDKKTHPITQAKVDRYYYIFPCFNYGFLPQTYEIPTPLAKYENLCVASIDQGDNDPVDVLELSGLPAQVGQICKVTVFGCLPLIDQGEIDWKVLAFRSDHPLAVTSLEPGENNVGERLCGHDA